jgi:FMN phosphatase YigB (HAD superfamily)
MLKAVLFDLDNTLIIYDEVEFFKLYFPMVASWFKDLISPDKFAEKLMQATLDMHQNDGSVSNRERFLKAFCQGTGWDRQDIWKRFDGFYAQDWDRLMDTTTVPNCSREVLEGVQEHGLKTVIATNPIWPLRAQLRRLAWAGLDGLQLSLVTNIDNMSFCKPKLGYYEQVCGLIGERPESCLMVGDDPANDMVAARIGMKTYLTRDSLDHVESPREVSKQVIGNDLEGIPPATFEGPLCLVTRAVENLLQLD